MFLISEIMDVEWTDISFVISTNAHSSGLFLFFFHISIPPVGFLATRPLTAARMQDSKFSPSRY